MMISNITNDNGFTPSQKRKNFSEENEDVKKAKTTSQENDISSMMRDHILAYLPFKDLLSFEQTSKANQDITKYAWQLLRIKDFYNFNWQACETVQAEMKDKWNYILGAALWKYSNIKQLNRLTLKEKEAINRFQGLSEKFSSFGDFINSSLILANALDMPVKAVENSPQINDIFNGSLSCDNSWAGESLLAAILKSKAKNKDEKAIAPYYTNALKKGATLASLIALENLGFPSSIEDIKMSWAIESANKEDFRALEIIVQRLTIQDLEALSKLAKTEGYARGPLLDRLAWLTEDDSIKSHLYDQAIFHYGKFVPSGVLYSSARAKVNLKDFKGADQLYNRALAKQGENAPTYLEAQAASVKIKLGEFKIADQLYTKSLAKWGEDAPADDEAQAAFVKLRLGDFEGADKLYNRALANWEKIAGTNSVFYLANNARLENKFEGANQFYVKVVVKWGDYASADDEALAARIADELGDFKVADQLYTKVLAKWGENAPTYLEARAISVKLKLGDFEGADKLITQALAKLGENALAEHEADAAFVKLKLGDFKNADQLFTKALAKWGENAQPQDEIYAAFVKYKINDFKAAYTLYIKALEKFDDRIIKKIDASILHELKEFSVKFKTLNE